MPVSLPKVSVAADFVNEMYLATVEECLLVELASGTVDMEPSGPVRHGPWDPSDCAAVLLVWLTLGWVELERPFDGDSVLSNAETESILRASDSWAQRAPGLCLAQSVAGAAQAYDAWIAAITGPDTHVSSTR